MSLTKSIKSQENCSLYNCSQDADKYVTNPNEFDLDFFVNNLRAGGASTFESIGLLKYNQNGSISMVSAKSIATDGLVLRGHYSAVTLAVYGTVSEPTPDPAVRPANAVAQSNDKVCI